MEEHNRTATVYYTATFEPMYVALPDNRGWYSLDKDQLKDLTVDPDEKALKDLNKKEFTYLFLGADTMLETIAAAANAEIEKLKMAEEEEEEEEEAFESGGHDPVDVTAVADPVAAKRGATSDYKISHFLTPAMIFKINQAIKVKSYTLPADGKTMTKSFGDRQITIHENGGMSSNPITTGTREKVAAILADDLITIFRSYAVLYHEGKEDSLPDGIINLRINTKGLSIAQQRAHFLLVNDVRERFYAELKRTPNAYPDAFLKKFKFDGEEIRVDLKRKAAVSPDATPDAKKPATTPAPAATSKYLSGVITNLEKDPNDKAAKDLLISILNGTNTLLAADGNVVKPKTPPTSPEENAALQKALGCLQEVLSKHGYDKATVQVNADSVVLPKIGNVMAAEIKAPAVAPSATSPRASGRI